MICNHDDEFLDAHTSLATPLKIAVCMDELYFPEDDEILDAYGETLWSEHIMPGVVHLFGEAYAAGLEPNPRTADKLLAFLQVLGKTVLEQGEQV